MCLFYCGVFLFMQNMRTLLGDVRTAGDICMPNRGYRTDLLWRQVEPALRCGAVYRAGNGAPPVSVSGCYSAIVVSSGQAACRLHPVGADTPVKRATRLTRQVTTTRAQLRPLTCRTGPSGRCCFRRRCHPRSPGPQRLGRTAPPHPAARGRSPPWAGRRCRRLQRRRLQLRIAARPQPCRRHAADAA